MWNPLLRQKPVYLSIAALLLVALGSTLFRIHLHGESSLPTGDSAWQVSILHEIEVVEPGGTIRISPPYDTRYARLYSQALAYPGLRQIRSKTDRREREIVLTARNPGHYQVESTFSIQVSSVGLSTPKPVAPTEQNRQVWMSSEDGITVNSPVTDRIIAAISQKTPEAAGLIEQIYNYVSTQVRINSSATSDSDAALKSHSATALGSIRALIALLRSAHLPARMVSGIDLHESPQKQPLVWAEVFDGNRWVSLDSVNGYYDHLPPYYVPVRKGDHTLATGHDARISGTTIKITTTRADASLLQSDSRKITEIFSLNRLAPVSRETLAVLLLLPLGVLSTEIVRQFAGIRTYGTFTPTLLALAITHVAWTTAIIVIALVTAIGFTFRASMPDLNLQRTPRLAIVFTLVALSMSLVVSGFSYFDPALDSSVVLLPAVILTMMVDRIYTVYDERGARIALQRLLWTIMTSFIALLVLLQTHWGAWLVSYPEMHAATLAAIILIGLYDGPRLKDLPYFHWIREPARKIRNRLTDGAQSGQSGDSM